jgi:hypothetical protein
MTEQYDEQDEINASYQRLLQLDVEEKEEEEEEEEKEYCIACKKEVSDSVQFCNAQCENKLFCIDEPLTCIGTPFSSEEDLFEALGKGEIETFIAQNKSMTGGCNPLLSLSRFVSPYDAVETDKLFREFALRSDIMCVIVATGFYKCYKSEMFETSTVYVKMHLQRGKNPIMEFRRIQGCFDIFLRMYNDFKNQPDQDREKRRQQWETFLKKQPSICEEEENIAIVSIVRCLKSNPASFIKITCQTAVGMSARAQIIMFNEVYNLLHMQPCLKPLLAQIMGYIDCIKSADCLLDDKHKALIIGLLKHKLDVCMRTPDDIHKGVAYRIKQFISSA